MPYTLDDIDARILQLLQQSGNLSHKEIGERLNKSQTSIYVRVRRLQEEGYIKGYVALVDPHKMGIDVICFTHVKIRDHLSENLRKFAQEVSGFDEVIECFKVSGEFDFILKVAARDLDAYHDFLENVIRGIVPLYNVESAFVLQGVKTGTRLPVGNVLKHGIST